MAKSSPGRQFKPQINTIVDDTRALIRNSRQNNPIAMTRQGADSLVTSADDLAKTVERITSRPASNLPAAVTDDLRTISEASKRIGRSGSDDLAELSTIENSMQRLRTNLKSTPNGQGIIDDLEGAVARTENAASNLSRNTRIGTLTDDAAREAETVSRLVKDIRPQASLTGKPATYITRQLDEIETTAKRIVDSADPSAGIRSIKQNIANLKQAKVTVPRALEESVEVLGNRASTLNSIRSAETASNALNRVKEVITRTTGSTLDDVERLALRSGDDITIKAGTEARVARIVDDLADDATDLARANSPAARLEIQKRIDNSIRALKESGNTTVANQLDEAFKVQKLARVEDTNRLLAARIEAQAAELVPSSTRASAEAARDTLALTKIETAARKLIKGEANSERLASLSRSIEELSPALREQFKPLLESLKTGSAERSTLVDDLVSLNARGISDDLTRNGRLLKTPETFAVTRQRIDNIRNLQGDSEALRQLSNVLHELEADMARIANPAVFRSAANWATDRLGLTRAPAHVEGLASDSAKIRSLVGESQSPGLIGNLGRVLQAEPQLAGQMAKNTGYLVSGVGSGYLVADAWYRGYIQEINSLVEKISQEKGESNGQSNPVILERATSESRNATFIKADTGKTEERETVSDFDFSPTLGKVIRASGMSETVRRVSKLTGVVVGSDYDMAEVVSSLRDSGKARRWSAIGGNPNVSVEVARTVNNPYIPVTFKTREPDSKQPQVTFEKPAQPRFNQMKVAELMGKLKTKEIADVGTRLASIYGGGQAASTTAFSSSLRNTSAKLVQAGLERTEGKGLDNIGTGGGAPASNQATFTTYASNTGLQFTGTQNQVPDPASTKDEEDQTLLSEFMEVTYIGVRGETIACNMAVLAFTSF